MRFPHLVPETVDASVQVVLPVVDGQVVYFFVQCEGSFIDAVSVASDDRPAEMVGRREVFRDRFVAQNDILELSCSVGYPQSYNAGTVVGQLHHYAAVVGQGVECYGVAVEDRVECCGRQGDGTLLLGRLGTCAPDQEYKSRKYDKFFHRY